VAAWRWLLILGAALLVVYAAFVAALAVRGRRVDARAVAGFVPDCVVLFKRLLRDATSIISGITQGPPPADGPKQPRSRGARAAARTGD